MSMHSTRRAKPGARFAEDWPDQLASILSTDAAMRNSV